MSNLSSKYRTHTCGELSKINVDLPVKLSGWVHKIRDHGGVVFIDLRDNYGVTQVVLPALLGGDTTKIRPESVISLSGKVVLRSDGAANTKLETGEIEVLADSVSVLSECDILPFQIAEEDNAPEPTRLKYRFLELRKERLHRSILLRSKVITSIRNIMGSLGFTEFQTPILTSSSPEGARDFLVPSRHYPGRFFALPQAPQQFKQLLMVAGFDRYFQIAPCFRDEDPRADRSPGEFYQCDLEMSFVEQEDVFTTCEQLFSRLFSEHSKWPVTQLPFPRYAFKESMERFGTDKPDLRNPLEIKNVSLHLQNTSFNVFKDVLAVGGKIRALGFDVKEIPSRKFLDDTVSFFQSLGNKGLLYLVRDKGEIKGTAAKFLSSDEVNSMIDSLALGESSLVFFGAGSDDTILVSLGKLRMYLGEKLIDYPKNEYKFCWITDFPMYERDPETGNIDFSHNPFSMPQGEMDALLNKDPLDILAYQYDVVCNGYELSSGAIRNHRPDIMYKAFELVGYPKEEVDRRFGGMIRAFQFGAPPHGGMAPGIDRIVMLLAQESAIRDVIAFPLAQSVEDLLMGAPGEVSEKQLRECHIQVRPQTVQR